MLSSIHIKGKVEPILISADRAKIIKQKWAGDNPVPRNQVLDLGSWCGEYGQIKSIEIEKPKKYDDPEPIELELTPDQKIERRKIIDAMTIKLKEAKILPKNYPYHKGPRPYEITRTALLAYKELHGVEYQLPENAIIIEE